MLLECNMCGEDSERMDAASKRQQNKFLIETLK